MRQREIAPNQDWFKTRRRFGFDNKEIILAD